LEGTYQIHGGGTELFESFVAAPGPAGWRYFARVFPSEGGEELSTVDFVVDVEWRLVRYRERSAAGSELVVIPALDGVAVLLSQDGEEESVEIPGVELVWSRSPCSLLVAERRARAVGTNTLRAVRIHIPDAPAPVQVSLDRLGREPPTAASNSGADRIQIRENGRTMNALVRQDLPLIADGWFSLLT
jgi:hypothetical protein